MSVHEVVVPQRHASAVLGADAYDVRERIAIGTAAVVYRAVHRVTGAQALFKVLQGQEIANPLDVPAVLARRTKLSAVRHPNIAELIEMIEDEEGCVLIYNYLAGKGANLGPLDQEISAADAVEIARQLCDALLAGERQGIPHGEIKPSNVVISRRVGEEPQIQVQDWGLAECRIGPPPLESMIFMAPERLRGGRATIAADLFSLGATLVFLVTGHLPVPGGTAQELLVAWEEFDAAEIGLHRPDLDASFVKWLGWLLRIRPNERPSSVVLAVRALHGQVPIGENPTPEPAPVRSLGAATQPLTALPSVSENAGPEVSPPSAPGQSLGQRLFGLFCHLSLVAGIVVLGMWLAEIQWGPGWRADLARKWDQWRNHHFARRP